MGSRAAPPLEKGIGGGTLSKAVARKGQEAHAVLEVGQGVRFVQRENGERRSQPQEPRVLTPSTAEETTAPLPARPPALLGPPAPRPQPRPPLRPHSRWRRGEAVRGARRKWRTRDAPAARGAGRSFGYGRALCGGGGAAAAAAGTVSAAPAFPLHHHPPPASPRGRCTLRRPARDRRVLRARRGRSGPGGRGRGRARSLPPRRGSAAGKAEKGSLGGGGKGRK